MIGDVAFVNENGSGNICTFQTPCALISTALTIGKPVIRVNGRVHQNSLSISSGSIFIVGEHDSTGTITSGIIGTTGAVLAVGGTAMVTAIDMDVDGSATATTGISSTTSAAINLLHCIVERASQDGILATAGVVNIRRSIIRRNMKSGLNLFASHFVVENTVVAGNGSLTSSALGGISLIQSSGSISFSTIADNAGANNMGAMGVRCSNTTGSAQFSSNIVFGNANLQVSGDCLWTYSDFDPLLGGSQSGIGNVTLPPSFVDDTSLNFHLDPSSSLRDLGDPTSTLDVDIDGNARPQGNARDIGADELMP